MSTNEHAGRALVDRRSEGGRCEVCGRLGTNVHHRMRQARPWNGANLLRVCGAGNASGCHGWIETHPGYAGVLGLIVLRGHDPATVPVFCKPVLFDRGWWLPDDEGMWHLADRITTFISDEAVAALQDHLESRRSP